MTVQSIGLIVTRKIHRALFSWQTTLVVPTGKQDPDGGAQVTAPHVPVGVAFEKVTTVPGPQLPGGVLHTALAAIVMSLPQVNEHALDCIGFDVVLILLADCRSVVVLETLTEFMMTTEPSPATLFTFTAILKTAVSGGRPVPLTIPTGNVAMVPVTFPVPPTAGVMIVKTGPESC